MTMTVFFFLMTVLLQMGVPRSGIESQPQLLTFITAVAMPDPLIHCARLGIEPCLNSDPEPLQPLCHSGNSNMIV